MLEIAVPILGFFSVVALGGAVIVARDARRERVRERLMQFGPLDEPAPGNGEPAAPFKMLENLGGVLAPGASSTALRQQMARAGFFSPAAAGVYLGIRTLALVTGLAAAAVFVLPMEMMAPLKFMLVIGGGWVASMIPSLYVDMCRRHRTTEVQQHLPDAVDLLEICVSAGMGLDMAWNAVTEEIRRVSPVLGDEMSLTNLEVHLGAPRAEAMRHMAERTGSDDLTSLVSTLVQSERFGTAVSEALRSFAESMRETRMARAAEAAEKLGIKMLFPMIGFILPAILIVMGGGAVIKIMHMFNTL